MKRSIKVREQELIDKLNSRYNIAIDPALEGSDKTEVVRWDNHGPVQFEGQDTETTIVKEENELPEEKFKETPDTPPASWDKDIPDRPEHEVDVNLDPMKNVDDEEKKRFETWGPCSFEDIYRDSVQDAIDSRKGIETNVDMKPMVEDIAYKRYMSNPTNLRALKRALADVDKPAAEGTRLRPQDNTINVDLPFPGEVKTYEEVNHPQHYNNYDVEVIDMMERVFGKEATITFCKLNAFKYRMRAGTKPNQSAEKDLNKEKWYLDKAQELRNKLAHEFPHVFGTDVKP